MVKAVFDTNVLVSAFLTGNTHRGVSAELFRFIEKGTVRLYLSPDTIAEALVTLVASDRLRARYGYTVSMALQFSDGLHTVATLVVDPSPVQGAVPRDPDDDKIIACAVAAEAEYLVTRDNDLLSIGHYDSVEIVTPEIFLRILRSELPTA